jgi:hypothetical protein
LTHPSFSSGWFRRTAGWLSSKAWPLYIQEKVHPKVLVDDLRRETESA